MYYMVLISGQLICTAAVSIVVQPYQADGRVIMVDFVQSKPVYI